MIAFAVILCMAVWFQSQQGQNVPLLAGRCFTARDLSHIEGVFAKLGLDEYEFDKGRVLVPKSQRSVYVSAVMEQSDLLEELALRPIERPAASPFESSEQRQCRQKLALERELSVCLRRMVDIEDACVILDEATAGMGLRRQKKLTAMVAVQPSNGKALDTQRVRSIRELVASAKAQMSAADVTVTNFATGVAYSGQVDQDSTLARMDEYALRKSQLETQWEDKIESMLSFIPGIQVATNVEFSRLSSPESEQANIERRWLQLSSLNVSVGIPDTYYQHTMEQRQQVGQESTTLATVKSETQEMVHDAVSQLVPATGPSAMQTRITVTEFPDFRTDRSLVRAGQDGGRWLPWERNWFWAVALLAVGCSFWAGSEVWREFAALMHDQSSAAYSLDGLTLEPDTIELTSNIDADADATSSLGAAPIASDSSDDNDPSGVVHEELTHLVRENPAAAAELLKKWVDKAA